MQPGFMLDSADFHAEIFRTIMWDRLSLQKAFLPKKVFQKTKKSNKAKQK